MKLNTFIDSKKDKFINLLIANKGNYVYYIELTDELRLSTKKFPNGELILKDGDDFEISLGPVTYVGKL